MSEREPISNELRMDDVRRLLADTEMELWYCARVMSGYNELRFARRAAEAAAKKIREAFAAEKYLEGK